MSYKIYLHNNKINNKKYIGITSNSCSVRWGNNGKNYSNQPKFWKAIQKYGWDNFEHIILDEVENKEEALKLESDLIKKYNSIEKGYNVSSFGNIETKSVICTTTGKIFNSINEAAEYYSISNSNLSHCLNGDYDTCGIFNNIKLEWKYYEDSDKNEITNKKRAERKKLQEQKFYTEESLKIVELYKKGKSLRELSRDFHKSKESIKTILNFHNINILTSKQKICHSVNMLDNEKNIIKTFESLTEAAKYVGIGENNIGRIKTACNENWRKVKGYFWEWN